jgi:hypothetical protein
VAAFFSLAFLTFDSASVSVSATTASAT